MVVNPFLQKKKKKKGSNGEEERENDDIDIDDIGIDDDVVSFDDDCESEDPLSDADFVVNVRKTVSDIRKIASYIKNSTMAKEKLQLFEAASRGRSDVATNDADSSLLTMVLDVATRWNSAYDMLTKMLRHKDSIISFLNFLKTAAGRSEFGQKKLPTLCAMQWASIEGLCILLKPFYELTKILSGERMVKSILSNRCSHKKATPGFP